MSFFNLKNTFVKSQCVIEKNAIHGKFLISCNYKESKAILMVMLQVIHQNRVRQLIPSPLFHTGTDWLEVLKFTVWFRAGLLHGTGTSPSVRVSGVP